MSKLYYLGVDVETTGLDPNDDYMIELAAVLLDENLTELDRYVSVIDNIPATEVQADIGTPFVVDMHTRSGLIDAIAAAHANYDPKEPLSWQRRVDRVLVKMLKKVPANVPVHLLGDSVSFDRKFMAASDFRSEKRLHHRLADCSSLRLCMPIMPKETTRHRAMADIEFSILTWGVYQDVLGKYRSGR